MGATFTGKVGGELPACLNLALSDQGRSKQGGTLGAQSLRAQRQGIGEISVGRQLTQRWKETLDGKSSLSVLFTLVLSLSLLHTCFILKRMKMLSEVLLPSEDLPKFPLPLGLNEVLS